MTIIFESMLKAKGYEIETGIIYAYDPVAEDFTPLVEKQSNILAKK